jgi:two-component system, OmpR family, response regulator RpaA
VTSILVVDDSSPAALVTGLRADGYVVATAANGEQAARAAHNPPDLVQLQSTDPDNGITLCRTLRRLPFFATTPILFVSLQRDHMEMLAALTAGADDYLARPFLLRELELRIDSLIRRIARQVKPTARTLDANGFHLDCDTLLLTRGSRTVRLTEVECTLLRCLMSRPGQVFRADELLQEVWGYYAGTGDPTLVRMHICDLRRKVAANLSLPDIIRTVTRHGYALEISS